ncbi:MAG: hypothetical protein B6D61_08555 [Bacteroidetes bacterium 4484_249]|nr:MAG: hypothetical protein B6D61_08555 [Bacteroidetes bacterium 4484_249]
MKTFNPNLAKIIFFISVLISTNSYAVLIQSQPGGGDWSNGGTWIGGTPPSPTDDVEINGLVSLDLNTSSNNITINVTGTLQNKNNTNRTLTVNGNITNHGLIRDNYYNLTLNISGTIVNNGQWTNSHTNLTGNSNQYLTFNQPFTGEYFTSNMDVVGFATGTNALRFIGTVIDFNGDSLYMSAGYDSIFVNGGYLQEMTILAGGPME